MNTATYTAKAFLNEGTGAGYGAPAHLNQSGTGIAVSNSPRKAIAEAVRLADKAISAGWEARGIPAGQIPTLEVVELFKNGKLILERF